MESIKLIHVLCAYMTGAGFLLRGVLTLLHHPNARHRVAKTLPHLVDTCLFFSGLVMMVSWSLWPAQQPWLMAKLLALLLYIAFGMLMLRWGNTAFRRWAGFIGGLLVYLFIVATAHSKSYQLINLTVGL